MVDFLDRKLQVFISSTFSDLQVERQHAVEAILTAGHIPAGMELFTSGDETQMEVIRQWIDESDIYLLILGGRYGSIEPVTQKSYTQLEYEYALDCTKPTFACVIKEEALDLKVKKHGRGVVETEQPVAMKAFRELVLSHIVKFWSDEKDIKLAISETLSQFSRRSDLIGWVRPNVESNTQTLSLENEKLQRENSELREKLNEMGRGRYFNGLSFEDMYSLLKKDRLNQTLMLCKEDMIKGRSVIQGGYDLSDLKKLCLYGLLSDTGVDYAITEDGKVFLNLMAYPCQE